MELSILFWAFVAVTMFYSTMQLLGYNVITIVITLTIIDIIILELNRRVEKYKMENKINYKLTDINKNIEKVSTDVTSKLNSLDFKSFDDKLTKHKDDVNYVLDKMARKSLEIEENLKKFGVTLAAAISSLDERIKILETKGEKPEEITYEKLEEPQIYVDEQEPIIYEEVKEESI